MHSNEIWLELISLRTLGGAGCELELVYPCVRSRLATDEEANINNSSVFED